MPYKWIDPTAPETGQRLHIWPHRSLPKTGFVWFIAITSVMIALPLLAVIGSPVLWGLLPFLILAVAGVWMALKRSYADGQILEDLVLGANSLVLTRNGPRGKVQSWEANPHWVRLSLHATGGPVPNYLTMTGNGREVEIGAFLSEPERVTLEADLRKRLTALREPRP